MKNTNHLKDFSKLLKEISYPKQYQIDAFRDFLIMAHISIANRYYKDEKMEKEYMDVANRYNEDELKKFSELLGITALALNESHQDFLGEAFMSNSMGDSYKGQFFTPFHISEFMARINLGDGKEAVPAKGWFSMCEPSCGSGGMVIACDKILKEANLSTKDVMWAQAQDIDPLCFMMCFIQLSLLDIPARVVLGNTLALEEDKVLYTPAFVMNNWFEKIEKDHQKKSEDMVANNVLYDNEQLQAFASGKLF